MRADPESAGVTRIAENLRRYELWRPEYEARIVPLPGDLTAPGLGLSADTRAALAQDLDAIYHNGGAVNFLHPYDRLKAANVTGTVEVLRLAGTDRPTPVHFVSTLGVFLGDHYRGGRVTEADSPTEPEGLNDGYNQSKWVADALVREAAARGLPVTIHRPARVAGDSRTGVSNPDDYFSRMLKTFVQLGSVPLWNGGPDLYPVDCLAAAIGQASRDPEAWGGGFHYYNRAALTYDDVAAALRRAGFRIRRQPHAQWRSSWSRGWSGVRTSRWACSRPCSRRNCLRRTRPGPSRSSTAAAPSGTASWRGHPVRRPTCSCCVVTSTTSGGSAS